MLQRQWADNPDALRELFVLVGDKERVAAIDREKMGQSPSIQTTM